MKKVLISAGALAALALTSTPAFAQAVNATTDATATARIVQPLTLTRFRDLDLGTIVLNPGTYTDTITMSQAGSFSCGANVTCSGSPQTAQYDATGTMDQVITVSVDPTLALVNQTQTSPDLTLNVLAPLTATLSSTGTVRFDIGGSIQVSNTTTDGVYTGTFAVSADYQ